MKLFLFLLIISSYLFAEQMVPPLHHASGFSSTKELTKVAHDIDVAIAQVFQKHDFKIPEISDESTYLRRLFLVLCGRIPTLEETESYLNWVNSDKRILILDQLLRSKDYENHKLNWYKDLFRIRHGVSSQSVQPLMGNFSKWLSNQIRIGTTWKDLTYQVLNARGSLYNTPQVGFYLANGGHLNTNVSYIYETFLATNMACAECHDHPTDDYTRKDFYQTAAFLSGTKGAAQAKGGPISGYFKDKTKKIDNNKSLSEDEKKKMRKTYSFKVGLGAAKLDSLFYQWYLKGVGKGEIKLPFDYQYNNGKPGQIVKARIPETFNSSSSSFGASFDSKFTNESKDSLEVFAQWVISDNGRFAENIANRIWQRMMGVSLYANNDFYEDAEDLPYPGLVKALNKAVKELNYDTRAFEAALVLTKTFQFVSLKDHAFDGSFEMLQGRQLRRMSAEQLWNSIMAVGSGVNLTALNTYSAAEPTKYVKIDKLLFEVSELEKALPQLPPHTKSIEVMDQAALMIKKAVLKTTTPPVNDLLYGDQLSRAASVGGFHSMFGASERQAVNA